MRIPTTKILLLLLLVVTAAATFAGRATDTGICVPRERDVLLEFKRGITDDPAGHLSSWQQGSDCCQWRGVRCSNQTGHVLQLRLPSIEWCLYEAVMTGEISSSLFSLEHLEHLDLNGNWLSFPSVKNSRNLLFGSLKRLRYLSLSYITFRDGILPPQLGNLSKLQYLDLSYTTVWAQGRDISWLTRLPLLHHLDLSNLDLSMVDDWHRIVNMIPSLKVLYLSECSLQFANQPLPHLNLTKLEKLDLSVNHFANSSKSCWFWNLTSLRYLNLRGNSLYGEFPRTLGQMKSLQFFDFSGNILGAITTLRLMRNLCNLEVLNLKRCLAYGNMTEIYESLPRCSSSKLQVLDLRRNNITGNLPNGIGQFTSLVILDLSRNNLVGLVPFEIGMLNNLSFIDLRHNSFTGVITEEHFSGLTRLRYIDLSYNKLKIVVDHGRLPTLRLEVASFASCEMGPRFPFWLQWLVGIDYIDMSNTGINGQFPYWFSSTFSLATYLDFSHNQINGSLPKYLEMMPLDSLLLDRNQLTGGIPLLPKNLTLFTISNNALSGRIPTSFCKSQNLHVLDLSNNHFEGEFPQCIVMRELRDLFLSNNMFSGKFLSFLERCIDIGFLDLSGNKLSGTLPSWIGDLATIEYLQLSYNMFSGSIPSSITNLPRMYDFSLAGNRLSSIIPWNLSNLKNMAEKYYYLATNYNLAVVTKRQKLYYADTLSDMVTIDLSLNRLTGEIPEEIGSLGALVNLNLSWNYLTGNIPYKIGLMQSLESLDLSRNKLSGEIPQSLSNLTYLAWLDLSHNNLSGGIPSGSQLDTLYDNDPFMYSGNRGLCGPPLQRNCSGGHNATRQGDGDQKRSAHVPDLMFFHFGLASGFVVGLWVVFCTMIFKKTWTVAYFRLFDKVYDKIYVFFLVTRARLA